MTPISLHFRFLYISLPRLDKEQEKTKFISEYPTYDEKFHTSAHPRYDLEFSHLFPNRPAPKAVFSSEQQTLTFYYDTLDYVADNVIPSTPPSESSEIGAFRA